MFSYVSCAYDGIAAAKAMIAIYILFIIFNTNLQLSILNYRRPPKLPPPLRLPPPPPPDERLPPKLPPPPNEPPDEDDDLLTEGAE